VSFSGVWPERNALRRWGLVASVAAVLTFAGVAPAVARPASDETVALSQLPTEARDVHRLILAGGPFAHPRDGAAFGNRERLLPARPRGYYREYTVATPGAGDRGARRIVCGGFRATVPDTCYYTADHYTTFRRISP
jgi:ribonuclease T1